MDPYEYQELLQEMGTASAMLAAGVGLSIDIRRRIYELLVRIFLIPHEMNLTRVQTGLAWLQDLSQDYPNVTVHFDRIGLMRVMYQSFLAREHNVIADSPFSSPNKGDRSDRGSPPASPTGKSKKGTGVGNKHKPKGAAERAQGRRVFETELSQPVLRATNVEIDHGAAAQPLPRQRLPEPSPMPRLFNRPNVSNDRSARHEQLLDKVRTGRPMTEQELVELRERNAERMRELDALDAFEEVYKPSESSGSGILDSMRNFLLTGGVRYKDNSHAGGGCNVLKCKFGDLKGAGLTMPIREGRDTNGGYMQWGNHGHKYYFQQNNMSSRKEAYQLAVKQGQAAHANGYRGK